MKKLINGKITESTDLEQFRSYEQMPCICYRFEDNFNFVINGVFKINNDDIFVDVGKKEHIRFKLSAIKNLKHIEGGIEFYLESVRYVIDVEK